MTSNENAIPRTLTGADTSEISIATGRSLLGMAIESDSDNHDRAAEEKTASLTVSDNAKAGIRSPSHE